MSTRYNSSLFILLKSDLEIPAPLPKLFSLFVSQFNQAPMECLNCNDDNTFSVLVITETKGFVHRSAIKAGKELIADIGKKNCFNVYHSKNSDVITTKNLSNISSIIFLNTT